MREWRGEMSQKAAALSCDIKQQVWNRYEHDDTEPAADSIRKICNFFGRSADELLGLPSRGGSATARGDGAIAAAGSNIHIEVGKSAAPGEMPSCKKCPHLKKLKELQKMIAK